MTTTLTLKNRKKNSKENNKKIRFNPTLQNFSKIQKSDNKAKNFNIWDSVNTNLKNSKIFKLSKKTSNQNISQNLQNPHNSQIPNSNDSVRLSKIIANRNLCSRREADDFIVAGLVSVDGKIATLGQKIPKQDIDKINIQIAPKAKKLQSQKISIILHKPVGYVSGTPEGNNITALTLITAENQEKSPLDPIDFSPNILFGLAPAGRLDSDSSGLLIYTQDGRIAKQIIGEHTQHKVEKEYLVRFNGEISEAKIQLLRHGLELDGKPLKPARVKLLNEGQLHFILQEGKKRQIRRMCELVGLQVIGLKRVRIGKIMLKNLALGHWRFLRKGEKI